MSVTLQAHTKMLEVLAGLPHAHKGATSSTGAGASAGGTESSAPPRVPLPRQTSISGAGTAEGTPASASGAGSPLNRRSRTGSDAAGTAPTPAVAPHLPPSLSTLMSAVEDRVAGVTNRLEGLMTEAKDTIDQHCEMCVSHNRFLVHQLGTELEMTALAINDLADYTEVERTVRFIVDCVADSHSLDDAGRRSLNSSLHNTAGTGDHAKEHARAKAIADAVAAAAAAALGGGLGGGGASAVHVTPAAPSNLVQRFGHQTAWRGDVFPMGGWAPGYGI